MAKSKFILIILLLVILLTGCFNKQDNGRDINIGTIAGPETALMQTAKIVAKKKYNLNINIVTFNDYAEPNRALAEGEINANMFQHKPYLDNVIKSTGYNFCVLGRTFIYPMGLYSNKYKKLSAIPKNSDIAIPNDPSNAARALILLSKYGLIKLAPGINPVTATKFDIINNPLNLQIKELDAASIPRVLNDVALAAINTNYAISSGLTPTKDAIALESKDSPYANVVVVNCKSKNQLRFKNLMLALHSEEVVAEADKLFKGQSIKAW